MTCISPKMLAAIHYSRDDVGVSDTFDTVVRWLHSQGVRVCGYLQREVHDQSSCCAQTFLEGISTGEKIRISQPLGNGSTGCRLDPHALSELSGRLLSELETRPDFLIVNRFGRGEADGHGFRSGIEMAYSMGIPVLTAVRDEYLEDWRSFGAELATELPPLTEEALAWCRLVTSLQNQDLMKIVA